MVEDADIKLVMMQTSYTKVEANQLLEELKTPKAVIMKYLGKGEKKEETKKETKKSVNQQIYSEIRNFMNNSKTDISQSNN